MRARLILICAILMLSASTYAECPTADLSGDCFVGLADLAVMAIQWMTEGARDIVLVDIPAGTFQMGDSFDPEVAREALPVHSVTLDSFKMSKYEITNQQYCDYLNSAYPAQLKVVSGLVYASSDDPCDYPYCETHSD